MLLHVFDPQPNEGPMPTHDTDVGSYMKYEKKNRRRESENKCECEEHLWHDNRHDASAASPAVIMIIMSTHLLHLKSRDNHDDASSASPAIMIIKAIKRHT